MPLPTVSDAGATLQEQSKPRLSSFDSGQEFDLAHLAEVCRLVQLAEREDEAHELKGYVFEDSLLVPE